MSDLILKVIGVGEMQGVASLRGEGAPAVPMVSLYNDNAGEFTLSIAPESASSFIRYLVRCFPVSSAERVKAVTRPGKTAVAPDESMGFFDPGESYEEESEEEEHFDFPQSGSFNLDD